MDASLRLAMHSKVFSPTEEACEADSKLLHQAALTQAMLGGVTKMQGRHK